MLPRIALTALLLASSCASDVIGRGSAAGWPPALGKAYPSIRLLDASGTDVRLDELRGRIVLLELVGMSCPACQAFSGAHDPKIGPFGTVVPQPALPSLADALRDHAGVDPLDPRLAVIQVLLYDMSATSAAKPSDVLAWAKHFGLGPRSGVTVVAADASLVGPASHAMIPGFHLLDENLTLVKDGAGHAPKHDIWTDLLPELGRRVRALPISEGGAPGMRLANAAVTSGGGATKLRDALKGRRTLLYAYSGCCGHCSAQLAALEEARKRVPGTAAWVGLEYLGNAASCVKPTKSPTLPGVRLADPDGSACSALGVGDFTLFVVAESGEILLRGGVADLDRAAKLLGEGA